MKNIMSKLCLNEIVCCFLQRDLVFFRYVCVELYLVAVESLVLNVFHREIFFTKVPWLAFRSSHLFILANQSRSSLHFCEVRH